MATWFKSSVKLQVRPTKVSCIYQSRLICIHQTIQGAKGRLKFREIFLKPLLICMLSCSQGQFRDRQPNKWFEANCTRPLSLSASDLLKDWVPEGVTAKASWASDYTSEVASLVQQP